MLLDEDFLNAQDVGSPSVDERAAYIDEIIVTARRKEERAERADPEGGRRPRMYGARLRYSFGKEERSR